MSDSVKFPECGKHLCETCGDCLACNSEDPCFTGEPHVWPCDPNKPGFPLERCMCSTCLEARNNPYVPDSILWTLYELSLALQRLCWALLEAWGIPKLVDRLAAILNGKASSRL